MPIGILLIAPEPAAAPLADALRRELDAVVKPATSASAGLATLRRRAFELILLDEGLATTDTETTDMLYVTATGPLLELNFTLNGAQRIVRQVRAALARRARNLQMAHTAAAEQLHGELNQTLAGLLLESELALKQASPEQAARLQMVVELPAICVAS